eukprot:1309068-Alexandrium_andersonii.AAC.1
MMPVHHSAVHRSLEAVQSDCEHLAAGEAAHPGRQSAYSVFSGKDSNAAFAPCAHGRGGGSIQVPTST